MTAARKLIEVALPLEAINRESVREKSTRRGHGHPNALHLWWARRPPIAGAGAGGNRVRFIEVKERVRGAETVTITKNAILTAQNKPDDWLLALVEVPPTEEFREGDAFAVRDERTTCGAPPGCVVRYVLHPFTREADFGATSVNCGWRELWARGEVPG